MPDVPYCSYNMRGKKEVFADWISNISPAVTPFTSMCKKTKTQNVFYEWQTDSLSVPDLDNSHVEGSLAEGSELAPTELVYNWTQLFRKVVVVSDTAGAVDSYGRNSEVEYQIQKASKELKRDVETTFLAYDSDGGPSLPGKGSVTYSLGSFVRKGAYHKLRKDSFSEDLFGLLEAAYLVGAEPTIILYHPDFAGFLANMQEETETSYRIFRNDTRFEKRVEVIESPLGQKILCIPDLFVPKDHLYLLDPKMCEMVSLREPKVIPLGKTGSAEKWMIEQEVGLRVKNPNAIFMGYIELGAPLTSQGGDATVTVGEVVEFRTNWDNTKTTSLQWFLIDSRSPRKPLLMPNQTGKDLSFTVTADDFGNSYFCRGYMDDGSFSDSDPMSVIEKTLLKSTVKKEKVNA